MKEVETWKWPSEAEEKAASAPFNLKDMECETVGGLRWWAPLYHRTSGGTRFQFGRWRDLEEVEDLERFRIELSPQILMLKSGPTRFLRL